MCVGGCRSVSVWVDVPVYVYRLMSQCMCVGGCSSVCVLVDVPMYMCCWISQSRRVCVG